MPRVVPSAPSPQCWYREAAHSSLHSTDDFSHGSCTAQHKSAQAANPQCRATAAPIPAQRKALQSGDGRRSARGDPQGCLPRQNRAHRGAAANPLPYAVPLFSARTLAIRRTAQAALPPYTPHKTKADPAHLQTQTKPDTWGRTERQRTDPSPWYRTETPSAD